MMSPSACEQYVTEYGVIHRASQINAGESLPIGKLVFSVQGGVSVKERNR